MIKLLETNTNRMIGSLERKVGRISDLEVEIENLKNNAGQVDPKNKTGGFSGAQLEQFQTLIKNVEGLKEKMSKLEIDYEALEPIKLKNDVTELKKASATFVSQESVQVMIEDVSKFRGQIADVGFEI